MKKMFKNNSVLETIVIMIALIVIGLTLKPFVLKVTNNLDRLDNLLGTSVNSLNNVTQMAAPSVTNGGSGGSSSSGANVKSVQNVRIICYGADDYTCNKWSVIYGTNVCLEVGPYLGYKSYSTKSINPDKTQVILPEGYDINYVLSASDIKVYGIKKPNSGDGQPWYYCTYSTATDSQSPITIQLIEYN